MCNCNPKTGYVCLAHNPMGSIDWEARPALTPARVGHSRRCLDQPLFGRDFACTCRSGGMGGERLESEEEREDRIAFLQWHDDRRGLTAAESAELRRLSDSGIALRQFDNEAENLPAVERIMSRRNVVRGLKTATSHVWAAAVECDAEDIWSNGWIGLAGGDPEEGDMVFSPSKRCLGVLLDHGVVAYQSTPIDSMTVPVLRPTPFRAARLDPEGRDSKD